MVNNKNITEHYYRNEDGIILYKVESSEWFQNGILKKSFRCYSKDKSEEWISDFKNIEPVLYALPSVIKGIKNNETIIYVEDEKSADALMNMGFIATTNFGGLKSFNKFSKKYSEQIKRADIIIFPHNSNRSKEYSKAVCKTFKNCCKSIGIIDLPDLRENMSIANWINEGVTKKQLEELINGPEVISKTTNYNFPIHVEDGCYYKYYKGKKVFITNFIIEPKHIIISPYEDLIKCELKQCNSNRVEERIFTPQDFNDALSFKKAVNSFSMIFNGSTSDLQHIKAAVSENTTNIITGVTYEGLHKINKQWFFVDNDNAVSEKLYFNSSALVLEDFREAHSNLLEFPCITKEELRKIAPSLFNFNALSVTATLIPYLCGLFLKGKLEHIGIKYNHLLIEGQSGSGKSQTLENIAAPLLGYNGNILDASTCTNFAFTKLASSSNFLPLIIDEYKPKKIGTYRVNLISNIMRNSYDAHKTIKGTQNLGKNIEFIPRSSVILCGEMGITETANIERSLKIFLSTSNLTKDTKKNFVNLKENSELLSKLGNSLLMGGLKMSEENLKTAYNMFYKKFSGDNIHSERIKESITNALLGLSLLLEVFADLGLNFKEATGYSSKDIETALKTSVVKELLEDNAKSKSVVDITLETLNRMAANGELVQGADYNCTKDFDGDKVLRLNYTVFYDRLLKYCKDHNLDIEVLTLGGFKKQISKMNYCKAYNKPTSFHVTNTFNGTKKTFRAAVLYVDKLKENNIDVDFMVE
ncbi:hypothetical protein JMF89_09725 [Clostridiaceae bacterium UIB06]|uniref:DUF927 domain-containing protein n=1 Tax=Clostridium thailandense TaxID=2794346 RepID=A0A949WVJ1_9CLOT|nr:hypothetical protein [Clostridium thailandense]MBV7273742.1 hypothetical protein [Clostridium thailandense]MCH5137478.1 hypothetical protein [Clostridiaceae bacterium UIB06]